VYTAKDLILLVTKVASYKRYYVERPCKRCILRNIANLCVESDNKYIRAPPAKKAKGINPSEVLLCTPETIDIRNTSSVNEFENLSEFLNTFIIQNDYCCSSTALDTDMSLNGSTFQDFADGTFDLNHQMPMKPLSTAERLFLTSPDRLNDQVHDQLNQVLLTKYENGLIKPHNYFDGYMRLKAYIEDNLSNNGKERIQQAFSAIGANFKTLAQYATDVDLVFVEESFERLLLEYDRIFSSLGIPACLWRRTGDIYKSNKEFASLVGIPVEQLANGETCIYELFTEESLVGYFENYATAFSEPLCRAIQSQCIFKTNEKACCMSFTLRRDDFGIPYCIVGNFLPI
jgi:hypothetical protein